MLWQVTKQTSSWNSDWIRNLIILQGAPDLIRRGGGRGGGRKKREGGTRRRDAWRMLGLQPHGGNTTSFVIYLSGPIIQCVWTGQSEKKKRGRAFSIPIYDHSFLDSIDKGDYLPRKFPFSPSLSFILRLSIHLLCTSAFLRLRFWN